MVNLVLICLSLAFFIIAVIAHTVFSQPSVADYHYTNDYPLPINPKTTVITFDLHGVLFSPDYRLICSLILRTSHKKILVIHSLNPFFWYNLLTLWRKGAVGEKYLLHVTSCYPQLIPCLPLFIALANAQKPMPASIALLKDLKQRGYTLHLFSNIGEQLFTDLKERFKSFFDYFEKIKITTAAENYVGKPHKTAFYNYLVTCNQDQKQVLFIDNKKTNIQAAEQVGIIGLHFRSPYQIQKQLRCMIV